MIAHLILIIIWVALILICLLGIFILGIFFTAKKCPICGGYHDDYECGGQS